MKYEKVTVFSNGIPYLTTPDFLRVPGLAAGFSTRREASARGIAPPSTSAFRGATTRTTSRKTTVFLRRRWART